MSEARREDGLLLDVREDIAIETRLHDGDNGYVFILAWKREDYSFESWIADESWDGVLSPKAQAALTAELRRGFAHDRAVSHKPIRLPIK